MLVKTLLTLLLASTSLALPAREPSEDNSLEARACAYYCGSVCYSSSNVGDAKAKGYSLYQSGSNINNYPHRYNNYEGFNFPVSGTYYEYPIMSSHQVYTGGSPGPDRVVFNGNNQLAGLITHTGASNNAFVECRSA